MGPPVDVWSVEDVHTPDELLLHCFPAFGAAYVRRIYQILDKVIGGSIPLVLAVAGPITISNQHRAWLNALVNAGWIASITTTDAACYHDGHDSLRPFDERPIREVEIEGRDLEYAEAGVIRVTDTGFEERILFEQDAMISTLLRRPEFQRRMAGPEFRNLLGKQYAAQEKKHGIQPGLLSTCLRNGVPVFVGSPGDGSAYLNHLKLWALAQGGGRIKHAFELDVAAEVFEFCAYHWWGINNGPKQLAILILGGGVPKNFSLQPEPTLSQIFLLPDVRGYDYDVQIVGAPVTDGSLTSCKPCEAHTWGKVKKEALGSTVESFQADYTTIMPLIAWALLDKRRRYLKMMEESFGYSRHDFFEQHPDAWGYMRENGGFRLYDKRAELMETLMQRIRRPAHVKKLAKTWQFPLATSK